MKQTIQLVAPDFTSGALFLNTWRLVARGAIGQKKKWPRKGGATKLTAVKVSHAPNAPRCF
jgi:hypothetical protein